MISQSGNTAIDKSKKNEKIQSLFWDIFTYLVSVLIDLAYIAFDTGSFDPAKMLDAFKSPSFWMFEIVKIIIMIIFRVFYVPHGLKKHRDNTTTYSTLMVELFKFRDQMLSDRRLDEFDTYLAREVDRVDKLEEYRDILDKKVIEIEKKKKLTKKELELIPILRHRQQWASELMNAYRYRNIVNIRRLEAELSVDVINVPQRTTITSSILFSNFSSDNNKDKLRLTYDTDKAISHGISSDLPIISAVSIIMGVAEASWMSTGSTWQQIVIKAVISTMTFFICGFTAFKRGITIGKNEIVVIQNRVNIVNDFNLQPTGFFTELYKEVEVIKPIEEPIEQPKEEAKEVIENEPKI